MKRIALFILLATISAHAQKHAPTVWTVEDIFKDGGPTGTPPRNIEWSPDGKLLTFLAPDDTVGKAGDLLALDVATNKISVLATAEKLTSAPISEKDKDHRARYGMPSYTWAADSKHLILDSAGVISLYDVATQTATLIVNTHQGSGDDPKFSPDAKLVSYLRDHNLFVAPTEQFAQRTQPHPHAGRHPPQRRGRLGLPRRARRPQQLLLVPRLLRHRLPPGRRVQGPRVPAPRSQRHPRHRRHAALPPARRPQPQRPHRHRQREWQQDQMARHPAVRRQRLHPALRLG